MKDRVETLGEVAWDVLHRMVRELLARKPGGHLVEAELRSLPLRLSLELHGAGADPKRFAAELGRSIEQWIDDAVQHAVAFRPGHCYCHRCGDAACEHSRPPSCRHVFVGYATTGTPRWEDFAQYCLDRKHPDVDRLYDQPPAFLTVVQNKRELHGGMIRAFRNERYELLGQVTAGFFPLRSRAEDGRGVLALTIQAAASRSRRGRLRAGLNLLGRAPGGDGLDALWDRHDDLPWRRSVRWAQSALATLEPAGRRGRGPRRGDGSDRFEQRVEGILRGLARRLERDRRARGRRTRHAEQRHASGKRPTRKALDDVREARLEACRVDEKSGTVVVLGDRGRTHFFTPEGQHVSSVRYSKEAIARKVKLELWRPATSTELEGLQRALASDDPPLARSSQSSPSSTG